MRVITNYISGVRSNSSVAAILFQCLFSCSDKLANDCNLHYISVWVSQTLFLMSVSALQKNIDKLNRRSQTTDHSLSKRYLQNKNLHGLSPPANYTDRATAVCQRSDCQLLKIKGATWSAWRIPTAVFSVF
jgi:hypothetical protein